MLATLQSGSVPVLRNSLSCAALSPVSLTALSTADCIPVVVLWLRWILGHLAERALLPSLSLSLSIPFSSSPPHPLPLSCNYFACTFCIFQMLRCFFLVSRRGQRCDCAVGVSPPYSAIAIGWHCTSCYCCCSCRFACCLLSLQFIWFSLHSISAVCSRCCCLLFWLAPFVFGASPSLILILEFQFAFVFLSVCVCMCVVLLPFILSALRNFFCSRAIHHKNSFSHASSFVVSCHLCCLPLTPSSPPTVLLSLR